jgi:hypothetical protein
MEFVHMKKNNRMFILFAVIGIIIGSIATNVLSSIPSIQILTKSIELSWSPQADLNVLRYAVDIHFKVNVLNAIGLVLGIWVYRKL